MVVWAVRIGHCRGFGVQSPWAYRMVRYVINEHWPYYAYAPLAARFPKRCKACLGLGVDACGRCDGTGVTERRERTEDEDGETVYETIKEACEKCGGTGALPCRRCDGSGLAKICSRCDGMGTVEAKAKRDVPAHTALCRACKGDGRR